MDRKTTFRGRYSRFAGITIIAALAVLGCANFSKLDIPANAFLPSGGGVLTPQMNTRRTNSVDHDVRPPYQILWSKRSRSSVTDHPLAVDNYLIYTLQNGTLGILNIERGEKIGDGHIAPGFRHAPTIADQTVYYSADLGKKTLGAFDFRTMKRAWQREFPQLNTSPLLVKDKIYVGANDGSLICAEKKSGEKKWAFQSGESIFGNPAYLDGKIYFANVKGKMFCLDTTRGNLLWEKMLSENIYAGPVAVAEGIFIGSTSGIMYALEPESGELKWQFETGGSIYGNAAYRNSVLYFGNNDHKLFALETNNGYRLWDFVAGGIINQPPLVGPEFVYFASWDKNFYVLDRGSGELIYRQEFKKSIKSSPIIYQNKIFLNVANYRFYCLANENIAKAGKPK